MLLERARMVSQKEKDALLTVLKEARELLVQPMNNFDDPAWSRERSLMEMDRVIANVLHERTVEIMELRFLFVPAGPLQDVATRSGWGKKFLMIADQFDKAIRPYGW